MCMDMYVQESAEYILPEIAGDKGGWAKPEGMLPAFECNGEIPTNLGGSRLEMGAGCFLCIDGLERPGELEEGG